MDFQKLGSWNSMIAVFPFHGLGTQAMDLFIQMQHDDIGLDRATLLIILSSLCGSSENDINLCLRFCLQLYCLTVKTGLISDVKAATALVKAYSDLGGDILHYRSHSHTHSLSLFTTGKLVEIDCQFVTEQ
ncbi:hypothetical protein FNV43_RR13957 [Rhamnella rubrinervis]|uniref:Pentatricopeptide repeat-containing protein n=1 Tax=Rhamnella rubrinervis TaxID=2594499 RepID=A0A8K0H235_9ROSA|nr:hypothetical protein FNV43_RR13957 [Rhamnella rubrinervis]